MSWLSSFIKNPVKSVESTVGSAGKNIEKNFQGLIKDTALMISDPKKGFNNLGSTILRHTWSTTPAGSLVNTNDYRRVFGATASERAAEEAKQAEVDAQSAADAAAAAEVNNMVSSVIQGNIAARNLSPGRRQTFLRGSSVGAGKNTLLTIMKP